jgi:hypothetical protein
MVRIGSPDWDRPAMCKTMTYPQEVSASLIPCNAHHCDAEPQPPNSCTNVKKPHDSQHVDDLHEPTCMAKKNHWGVFLPGGHAGGCKGVH